MSAEDTIADLGRELSAFAETAQGVLERLQLFVGVIETVPQLVRIDVECHATGGAVQLRTRLELSDGTIGLLSALRTGNADLRIIEQALGHPDLSVVVVTGDDAESGAGEQSAPGEAPLSSHNGGLS